ncbi:hypothetical protein EJB05_01021 [Eragrostis curvula]|uniref:Uncharacterized protein n=1 Tax=Eragrostis curvula TaxID=38414 RepID=A0A5J9WP86_9POAL|nr:hypothetical protein EJB05_01021 [Eragrostis curvula]
MAAALAKVLRSGRSGAHAQNLVPAAVLGRQLGSSPATPAAGLGRLMHTGRSAEQKALLLGARQVLSRNQKHVRMSLFSAKRFLSDDNFFFAPGPGNLPWGHLWLAYGVSLWYTLPASVSAIKKLLGYDDEQWGSLEEFTEEDDQFRKGQIDIHLPFE